MTQRKPFMYRFTAHCVIRDNSHDRKHIVEMNKKERYFLGSGELVENSKKKFIY